jgi:hypothetical protein
MNSRHHFFAALVSAALWGGPVQAAKPGTLEPLLAVPDQVVLRDDFATPRPLEKGKYTARQGTRWTMAGGVLRGIESSAEFQAKKKDHFGYEPRLSIPACPQEFIIQFDVRFIGGKPTAIVPFVEFGHHVARVAWAGGGAKLVADTETMQLAAAPGFKIEDGKWYRVLAEIKGDEFVIQFADGPTLYGRHASFTGQKDGFGVAGTKGGVVELDNVTVWSVKAETNPRWASARAKLPAPQPVQLKEKPPAKKKGG